MRGLVFLFLAPSSLATLRWGTFLVGLLTIAPFSFSGNDLSRVYPTYLRETGGMNRLAVIVVAGRGRLR